MDTLAGEFDDGYGQAEQAKPTTKGKQMIALFAYDVRLQATGTKELQKGLDRAAKSAEEHEMTWSVKKCTVFEPPQRETTNHYWIAGECVKVEKSPKYLGMTITAYGVDPTESVARL